MKLKDISEVATYRKEFVLSRATLAIEDTHDDPISLNTGNATPGILNGGM